MKRTVRRSTKRQTSARIHTFAMARTRKIAAYCRVSTLEQKKNGLGMDVQVRDVMAFAEAQNLVLSTIYRDEAESGVAEKRKQLSRLLRDCKRGNVDVVIIPSLDRLSRDVRIAENLFWTFDQLGIQVLIADMPNYNGANRRDVLLRQIREAIAEENRKDIIERLWKGRQERIRKGKPAGGNVPYGYDRKGKRLEVNDREAAIVRSIFLLASHGASLADIAVRLNEGGMARRNGGAWTRSQIHAVLKRSGLYREGRINYGSAEGVDQRLVLIEGEEQS
jgi:site-specific DNA recombinase